MYNGDRIGAFKTDQRLTQPMTIVKLSQIRNPRCEGGQAIHRTGTICAGQVARCIFSFVIDHTGHLFGPTW